MEKYFYLLTLFISIFCLIIVDVKYSLALTKNLKATIFTVFIIVGLFLLWDVMGISLNIFFEGTSKYTSGIMISPHLPIEEIFFLMLFSYLTLLLYRGFKK